MMNSLKAGNIQNRKNTFKTAPSIPRLGGRSYKSGEGFDGRRRGKSFPASLWNHATTRGVLDGFLSVAGSVREFCPRFLLYEKKV